MQSAPTTTTTPEIRDDSAAGNIKSAAFEKLWLPRIVYELLPYAYMALGCLALLAAWYMPEWTWILPYVALLGLFCIHAGLAVAMIRYRYRHRRQQTRP